MKYNIKNILFAFIAVALISSCKKDDDKVEPDALPKAIIIANSTAAPLDTVYLDGSTSQNVSAYKWTVNSSQGEVILLPSNDQSKVYFIAEKTGSYSVNLEVRKGDIFSQAYMNIDVSGALQIGGTLTSSVVLSDLNYSTDSCDYFLTEDLIIPNGMSLTIENGVTICAAEGVAIISEGNITVNGGAGVTIEALGDNWKGIHIKSGQANIIGLTIDKAGSSSFSDDPSEKAGMYIESTQMAKLERCSFTNSAGYGLVMKKGITIGSFSASYGNNVSGPAILSLETFSKDPYRNTFENPSSNSYLKLRGGIINSGFSFPKLDVPYQFLEDINIKGSCQLIAGVEIYVADTVGLIVEDDLIANGNTSKPIIIEGVTKAAGSWKGISCGSGYFTYTTVQYAGSSAQKAINRPTFEYACGLMVGSSNKRFSLENCTLSNNKGYGIAMSSAATRYEYLNNTISNNGDGAILADPKTVGEIANIQSVYDGYGVKPIITIHDKSGNTQTIYTSTWSKISAATASTDYKFLKGSYKLGGSQTWTIDKGVFIECDEDVSIELINGSTLDAQGTNAEKIVFKGSNSTAGYWDGIFADYNSNIKLDYVEINYGGGGTGNYKGCLNVNNYVNTSNSFVTNCIFLNGGTYDLYFPGSTDALDIKNISNNNTFVNTN